jgi:phosphoribosylformylglycinamidine cyclo-ligase
MSGHASGAPTDATTYRDAGVDYATLDEAKRLAMAAALSTSPLLAARGGAACDPSRGEPAFVFELGSATLAMVVEGLGTKSAIARHVQEQLGVNRFADVAYDTVAAIVNDLICVGALPLVASAYFATGSSAWYADRARAQALVEGWERACSDAGCVWGGGESPTLAGLLGESEIELAGAAVGALPPGRPSILGAALAPGDEIVLVASSGLHANGSSLARLVAERLPERYATKLSSGRTLGEALLDRTLVYVPLIAALHERQMSVSYLSHITGHGLLKLMRPARELTYRINRLLPVPEVLTFLVEQSGLDAAAAHRTFNMGAGFAVYCAAGSGDGVVSLAEGLGFAAAVCGTVEEGPKQVLLEPVDVRFAGDELELSATPAKG